MRELDGGHVMAEPATAAIAFEHTVWPSKELGSLVPAAASILATALFSHLTYKVVTGLGRPVPRGSLNHHCAHSILLSVCV